MTKFMPFVLDDKQLFPNPKCYIIVGKYIEFLTAFFNSSLFKYCFRENFPMLLGETRELQKRCFELIPIIKIDDKTNKIFEEKIKIIQQKTEQNQDTHLLDLELDDMIFDLYNLTKEERKTIGFIEIL
ncbi:hypothetical protein R83H12_00488 [Fibrobacteria bacterium R8-3-H12]